jgi:predicted ATPase/class 3 adenylate cyclase
MAEQPTGTVTLLFSDIAGSTALLQRLGTEQYAQALDLHRRLLRDAFDRHDGYEVDCEGDAFFVAFAGAADAVGAAAESQRALAGAEWPEGRPIRVRMGIHTGEPLAVPPKFVGLDVHKAARIMAAGHGGQVILSAATRQLLDSNFELAVLGEHRLKDLSQPEPLFQLLLEGLPREFPALKTLGSRPNNLPVVATPFIGRDEDLEKVRAQLLRSDVRVLTLTGPGGIGKTRLALQAAADALDFFPSGVFWVTLASLLDPSLVVSGIAAALAVREEPGEPLSAALARHLAEKELLLVLDNFEHVMDAASEVAAIIAASPNVRVLTTSREALRLQGEHLYDVPPLSLPAADELAAVEAVDAVQLFVARARAAEPTFAITVENAGAVAEIVRRVEGMPLAIELAAARIRALPPQALMQRLQSRLGLLTSGSRDAPERQQTLRATIEWSYDLLSEPERRLFARLSVFVGGCRLDAAEAVCDPDSSLGIGVFDTVTSLLDKSLLRQRVDPSGEPRYWMLETIREYAQEVLGQGGGSFEHRHAQFMAGFAKRVLDSGHRAEAARFLAPERDNLRAAIAWAVNGADSLGLPLATGYAHLCAFQGPLGEGRQQLQNALDICSAEPSASRARALYAAANLAQRQGDLPAACSLAEDALQMARETGEALQAARALVLLGIVTADEGDYERSEALQREGLAIFQEHGSVREIHDTLGMLGALMIMRCDYTAAQSLLEGALATARQSADTHGVLVTAANLGAVLARQGRHAEALGYHREALLLLCEDLDVQPLADTSLEVAAAASRTEPQAAAVILGGIDMLLQDAEFVFDPAMQEFHLETLSSVRSALDDAVFQAAWEQGRSMNAHQLLVHAVAVVDELASPLQSNASDKAS